MWGPVQRNTRWSVPSSLGRSFFQSNWPIRKLPGTCFVVEGAHCEWEYQISHLADLVAFSCLSSLSVEIQTLKDLFNRRDTFASEERTSQSRTDLNEQKVKLCCFCVKSISYIGFDRRLCLPSYNWEEEEMVKLFPKDAWTQRYLLISWISEVNTSEQTRSAISILGKSHQLWYAR